MTQVSLITTGGTIASSRHGAGWAADTPGGSVLAGTPVPSGVHVRVVDLLTLNSARLTTTHQLALLRAVQCELARPEVAGVVVSHGTDTLEESAFLVDLHHADHRPVVFTGAQLPFDAEDGDGPGNLRDALLAAATLTEVGTVVVFDGRIHPARGTVKSHTLDLDAFASPTGPIGEVGYARVALTRRPARPDALPLPREPRTPPRVDVVTHHCDADPVLFRAALAAGAEGVVLVATGAGNATPDFVRAVAEATARGVLVALTTRVAGGPVAELYTHGGAVDLVAAGAVPTGVLRAGQARIAVLSALLATPDTEQRRAYLRHVLALPEPADDPTGDEPTGDDPTGDDPTGDDPTGDDPTGEDGTANSGPDRGCAAAPTEMEPAR
ncbi:asparaginase [Kitasatospora sp. NPDC048365]|uniref:asparaginase n=1 Tax=Kitasatospora sp. NPDC048365 TaxID=3364050 RepID=UPI00371AE04E